MKKILIPKDENIKEYQTPQKSAYIIHKFRQNRLEVNIYEMRSRYTLYFNPPEKEGAVKSYYVLKGSLYCIADKKIASVGDLFILNYGDEPYHVKVIETCEVLVHALDDDSFSRTAKTFEDIYETLIKIQEKDSYTLDHSYNVHYLAEQMGMALGYKGERFLRLLLAAQYHDIGKIKVDTDILQKAGKLTDEEYEAMKEHAVLGKDLIVENFSEDLYQIISQHHERLDGSGYPLGLKGDEIQEEAKIIGICDSYDAMVSDRVYKKGKSKSEAIAELNELAGIKYDPYLVDIFLKLL